MIWTVILFAVVVPYASTSPTVVPTVLGQSQYDVTRRPTGVMDHLPVQSGHGHPELREVVSPVEMVVSSPTKDVSVEAAVVKDKLTVENKIPVSSHQGEEAQAVGVNKKIPIYTQLLTEYVKGGNYGNGIEPIVLTSFGNVSPRPGFVSGDVQYIPAKNLWGNAMQSYHDSPVYCDSLVRIPYGNTFQDPYVGHLSVPQFESPVFVHSPEYLNSFKHGYDYVPTVFKTNPSLSVGVPQTQNIYVKEPVGVRGLGNQVVSTVMPTYGQDIYRRYEHPRILGSVEQTVSQGRPLPLSAVSKTSQVVAASPVHNLPQERYFEHLRKLSVTQ